MHPSMHEHILHKSSKQSLNTLILLKNIILVQVYLSKIFSNHFLDKSVHATSGHTVIAFCFHSQNDTTLHTGMLHS